MKVSSSDWLVLWYVLSWMTLSPPEDTKPITWIGERERKERPNEKKKITCRITTAAEAVNNIKRRRKKKIHRILGYSRSECRNQFAISCDERLAFDYSVNVFALCRNSCTKTAAKIARVYFGSRKLFSHDIFFSLLMNVVSTTGH